MKLRGLADLVLDETDRGMQAPQVTPRIARQGHHDRVHECFGKGRVFERQVEEVPAVYGAFLIGIQRHVPGIFPLYERQGGLQQPLGQPGGRSFLRFDDSEPENFQFEQIAFETEASGLAKDAVHLRRRNPIADFHRILHKSAGAAFETRAQAKSTIACLRDRHHSRRAHSIAGSSWASRFGPATRVRRLWRSRFNPH
jgi:hypothetical protein